MLQNTLAVAVIPAQAGIPSCHLFLRRGVLVIVLFCLPKKGHPKTMYIPFSERRLDWAVVLL
jgi:hypothetical protein